MKSLTVMRQSINTDRYLPGVRRFGNRIVRQLRLLRFWYLLTPCLLVAIGCNDQSQPNKTNPPPNAQAANAQPNINQPNIVVSAGASPAEVSKVALLAIEAKDKAALERLVAVKKVKRDVEAITRKRSNFQGMLDRAIPTAVGAISSEVNWLDVEGREIDHESIIGTSAIVTVKGKRAGREQTRRFFLVQEDAQWRLVPSHR